jgi:hypothetical protein
MIDRNTMIIPSMPKHHAEYASKADDPNPLRPADVARLEKIKGRFFIKDPLSGRKDVEVLYVTSSNLNMLAYSHSRKVLRVEFKGSGKLRRARSYQYYGVPPNIFNALKRANSKGRFFYRAIRTSYAYQRLS